MIKAVFLDKDGVLLNSMKNHIKSWKQAIKQHLNINSNLKNIYLYEGNNSSEILEKILKDIGQRTNKKTKQEIIKTKHEIYNKLKTKDYNIKRQLNKLKKTGIKLIVVTGSSVKQDIEECYGKEIFDKIITADKVKHSKPSKEIYAYALKVSKLKPREVLVIENAPYGIISAKKNNLKVYAIETTLSREHLKTADNVFKTHKELFKKIFSDLNVHT